LKILRIKEEKEALFSFIRMIESLS
jgi:hypothetical protein